MRSLIGHLPCQTAKFADVVKDNDATRDKVVGAPDRGGRQLNGKLFAVLTAEQQSTAAQADTTAFGQAFHDGVTEGFSICLIDQRDQVGEFLAGPGAAAGPG